MPREAPESELKRLRKEQNKMRQDEVYGGLSPAELAEYDGKSERIHELEIEIRASAVAEESSEAAKAKQRLQWNKRSETDTPQGDARQSYRTREKDSGENPTDSIRQQGRTKKPPEEKGGE